jgi:hypothetical protein|tara:strand:+ start:73 stop:363 length:291 start_codon:yes stop_codon:yes gene_type:complete
MVGTNRLKSDILSYQEVAESVLGVVCESRFSAKSLIITNNKQMEQQSYYKVRYAGKLIKVVTAHSKWQAIDIIYEKNKSQFPWIIRQKLTAVKYKN